MVDLTNSHVFGGGPYAQPYADLPLPGGRRAGQLDDISFRREMARLGVADSWTTGRQVLSQRYAQMLSKVGKESGDSAIADWLESHKED
jgi:hypothetical protein